MKVKCESAAAYSVKALIPITGFGFFEQVPVEFFCGLHLCAACVTLLKPKDIFSQDVKASICQLLRSNGNSSLPDFARAELKIISINDLQLLQLESHHATIH